MTSKNRAALVIIGNAAIWVAVMIAVALLLQHTPGVYRKFAPVLGGAAAGSFFLNLLATTRSAKQCQGPANNPLATDPPSAPE